MTDGRPARQRLRARRGTLLPLHRRCKAERAGFRRVKRHGRTRPVRPWDRRETAPEQSKGIRHSFVSRTNEKARLSFAKPGCVDRKHGPMCNVPVGGFTKRGVQEPICFPAS
ncbi:hypothetical protein [Azospirillum doebereinerae]